MAQATSASFHLKSISTSQPWALLFVQGTSTSVPKKAPFTLCLLFSRRIKKRIAFSRPLRPFRGPWALAGRAGNGTERGELVSVCYWCTARGIDQSSATWQQGNVRFSLNGLWGLTRWTFIRGMRWTLTARTSEHLLLRAFQELTPSRAGCRDNTTKMSLTCVQIN